MTMWSSLTCCRIISGSRGSRWAGPRMGKPACAPRFRVRTHIAVVDMMMPGLSGIDVLKVIRSQSTMPVIMLTAKGDDIDRIIGLEVGADDYISKPCTPRELLARIRAVLRRTLVAPSAVQPTAIRAGAILLDPQRRQVECAGNRWN